MKPLSIFQLLAVVVGAVGLTITKYDEPNKNHLTARPVETRLVKAEFSLESNQSNTNQNRVSEDVRALVALGSRVAGTPTTEKALAYLSQEYQKAGYITEVQSFTYDKFEDRGSSLSIDGNTVSGRALNGSLPGNPTAPLVAVPNLGRTKDFAIVDVAGKIAVVKRGEIRFSEKAQNAVAAGAIGLIIVNNAPNNFWGTLGADIPIPVLSLGGERGAFLLENTSENFSEVTLNVDTVRRSVTGRNLIARTAESTQPQILLGGHYDSVSESPGANDNASGTAVVLDLARRLAQTDRARDVWFVAFDGEEDGLHGSRAFVEAATPEFLSQLKGMVNFDMVGVNSELKVSGTASLTNLMQSYPLFSIAGVRVGSDHIPFKNAGVPVLFLTRGLHPEYHTPEDIRVDPELLEETVRVGLKVTRQILD